FAGLSLYFEDSHDDLDDFGFDDYGSECDGIRITAFLDAGQDNLTPLGRLEKYAFSENVFNRQIVARGLLDVLREFSENENDFISVMETVARMSEDGEPTVRAELMEQVPNIAMFLHESQPNFPAAFSRYLVPIVVRYLTDPNNQVRKTSQAALLVLLEQGLICKGDMETKVCPVLLDLTEPSSDDDYKIEAVAIMCKLVTMLSKDTVEHLLLLRFCELCSDARLFQVRKVNTHTLLCIQLEPMSKFFDLCSDSLWGIRKACAECFMIVSNSTSPGVRRTKLSPLFISLISDQSRWVRQAAFQSLGRFISTFANPSSTGLYFKEDGTLLEVPRCPFDRLGLGFDSGGRKQYSKWTILVKCNKTCRHETEQTDENFNSFHYWRPPLPDISEELEMLKDQVPLQNQTAGIKEGEKEEMVVLEDGEMASLKPNVIPQQLLDQYLSMTDPARAQTVDTEIAKHCAFSLPGVALTLGQQNWHCLKDTYETLATDVQWKVRRTLAFSIHELAVILGDQLTAADLVPIFNGFLKDLDEVRIGVLKHLYDFLKLLHAEKRREYLYQLQEFMVTDNSRNWRFRYELAEQLILIIELYSHYDVYDYLRQIALTLCSDKVSEVRWISYKLVVEILQKMYACGAHDLGLNFINELIVRFCHCPKWVGRQAFAFICQAIVEEDCMPMDQFAQHLLPSLLSLSSDPVANVRVLVAKALRQSVMEKAYFKEPGSAYSDELEETVMALQADKDRDVRFFASQDPNMALMDTAALI
uniref:Serine/threonine-protein phosphatase 4 regulatory subunit 1 n=1 Tax=Oncorhynchus kisutch TaxID=8019 RepID=A0A8C7F4H4_ONCKI